MVELSILICHLPEPRRISTLRRLMDVIEPQVKKLNDKVEIIINDAGRGTLTTGMKRNLLIAQARGKYTVFIDDDDMVPKYYIFEILKAIQQDPDVITFNGYMTTDGANRKDFFLKLGEKYEARWIDGKEVYVRFPNHIVPMKKDLIRNYSFQDITLGEDYEWAERIHRDKVFKTSIHIAKDMYWYDCQTQK